MTADLSEGQLDVARDDLPGFAAEQGGRIEHVGPFELAVVGR